MLTELPLLFVAGATIVTWWPAASRRCFMIWIPVAFQPSSLVSRILSGTTAGLVRSRAIARWLGDAALAALTAVETISTIETAAHHLATRVLVAGRVLVGSSM